MTLPATQAPDRLLRVPDVAELTGIAQDTLRQWRHRGYGPRSARLGRRVVYRESEVLAWIDDQFAQPVAREGAAS